MSAYIITADDHRRITEVLGTYRPYLATEREQIAILRQKLAEAVIVDAARLSPEVVSMHSTVRVTNVGDRETSTYTLVYPFEAKGAKLSLLSPLGTALLGTSGGRVFECQVPDRTLTMAVREVLYQPERTLRKAAVR
jgi:regulator of nucleoside diphosphate kinase